MTHQLKNTRICTDPWTYIEIGTSGSIAPCCKYQPVTKISPNMNTVSAILNSAGYQRVRQQLLTGELSSTCASCHIRPTGSIEELEQRISAVSKKSDAGANQPAPREMELRIDLTTRCNLRCTYCAVSAPNYVGRDMETQTFSELVEFLKTLPKDIKTQIHINGHGETTYHPEWEKAAQAVLESGRKPYIITNLAKKYTQAEIDLLADFACIQISLDSADEAMMKKIRKPVRVSKILENLKAVRTSAAKRRSESPQISLSIGVYDPSVWKLLDLIEVAHELKIREMTFWNLVEYGHQKHVAALTSLDGEKLERAHGIMVELQRRLYLYKIDHVFAGDFMDQNGKSFLVGETFFNGLPQKLDALDRSDRLWILQKLYPDSQIDDPDHTTHSLPPWDVILNEKNRIGLTMEAPSDFDEAAYLSANLDVKHAMELGALPSAFEHYVSYGRSEGRRRPVEFD